MLATWPGRTAFVRAAAHESGAPQVRDALERIGCPDGRPDCVVLNSVTQCFPGLDYLEAVVHDALALVAPGGTVVVGDVRDARLLDDFARWAERDAEAARRRLVVRKAVEIVDRRACAPLGDLGPLGVADLVELVHRANSIQRASNASARPESIASAASAAPSA